MGIGKEGKVEHVIDRERPDSRWTDHPEMASAFSATFDLKFTPCYMLPTFPPGLKYSMFTTKFYLLPTAKLVHGSF